MSNATPFAYRPDVDGLRALAVLGVLFFHAFPSSLAGGFVGVDVFFVISGYLISGIIFDGLESGTFSFVEFYSRRVRRIFPALALVCTACLIFGWFSLMPNEFAQLGKHVIGGSAFISNFVLLLESGYFDTAAARKPLLHLWSLGVEEQYYLVWPALLFLLRKKPRPTLRLLLTLGAGSFALNLLFTWTHRSTAFYVPFTRFWELMIGSVVAHQARYSEPGRFPARWNVNISDQTRKHLSNGISMLGLCIIGLSLTLINDRRPFPGWWALLVCGGAALVIAAGPAAWINQRILGSRPLVLIGLISYPLYLWHWPILSFSGIIQSQPSIAFHVAALLASVALALLTYAYLELPLRRQKKRHGLRRVTMQLSVSMACVGIIGGLAWLGVVLPASGGDPNIVKISAAAADWESPRNEIIRGDVASTVLFFGDSHMEQYWPRVKMLLRQRPGVTRTVEFRTSDACAPIPNIERKSIPCRAFVDAGFDRAQAPGIDIVVLAASWAGFAARGDYYRADQDHAVALDLLAPETQWVFDAFAAQLAALRQSGKRVVVLLSSPRGRAFDPNFLVDRNHLLPRAKPARAVARADLMRLLYPIDSRIRRAAEHAGAEILDPTDWFCTRVTCPTVDAAGRPLLKDGSHLRASVVRARVAAFDQFVIVRQPASTR